jgi:hypothetical protein
VFHSVDRRNWISGFWTRNAIAVLREIAIQGPVVAACWWHIHRTVRKARSL